VIRSELLSISTTWSALSQASDPPGLIQVASVGQLQLSLGTTWAWWSTKLEWVLVKLSKLHYFIFPLLNTGHSPCHLAAQ
jgi:hypothetical protein